MEEASAFEMLAPASGNGVPGEVRQPRAHREPISAYHIDGRENRAHRVDGELASRTAPAGRGAPIDDAMACLVFHEARPIENLPAMVSPELKMIGRCVAFSVRQSRKSTPAASYAYVGLVSAITATTVTLMHVNRYTAVDFKAYNAREQLLAKRKGIAFKSGSRIGTDGGSAANLESIGTNPGPREPISDGGPPFYGCCAEGEEGSAQHRGRTSPGCPPALHQADISGSLALLPLLVTEEGLEATALARRQEDREPINGTHITFVDHGCSAASTRAARHRRFRSFHGSCGPIPYVTFSRKSIHEVEFGRDPRSSFYSLFQDPAKHIGDMQYLRMFVRRYLVHTSEGNNPRQVPLYAYLSARCAWPNLDRELVKELVQEELVGLLKTDRAIEKEMMMQLLQPSFRERMMLQYQAPTGIFSSTGILYLTHIPQSSFLAGALVLFLTLLFAASLGAVLGISRDAILALFVRKSVPYFVVSLVMWTLTGLAILSHAIAAHIPLSKNVVRLGARITLTLASIGCCLMTLFVIMGNLQKKALYDLMVEHQKDLLCSFYERHTCTGLFTACGSERDDPNLCSWCPNMPVTSTSCYTLLWSQVKRALSPFLVLNCSILVASLYAAYLTVKLLLFVESVMGRMV
ncbi:hypothetical protein GH5_01419 [Leishmania sp. Ghana 2012 LV757]|uniref:hypothetical protein n=1 Tax=Leishmania sp. Ghana 2012 LV757 TaxID=2803181 RepID=UPI001B5A85C2|nr:hypothetical protein GH5_01419 [Leishmania sp. Ghana 2012 LV757]